MNGTIRELVKNPRLAPVKATMLRLRGLMFIGRRYECPCCNASLRGFVGRWGFLRATADGYCPRCNAKARHRRIWHFLEQDPSTMTGGGRILEIAPWPALAAALRRLGGSTYVGLDLEHTGPHVTVVGDAVAMPFPPGSFDFVLCIHVLEHIEDDRSAISALFDIVKPGGWALVSVPLRLDRPTHEDPSITDPDERARIFGERSHVRFYGTDFFDRLVSVGFQVDLDPAADIPSDVAERYGLRYDENLFRCMKPIDSRGRVDGPVRGQQR
ncbi:MAG: class I SAM-dependent methyltransferase [Acidimicrobiia bacterium]|nr:class I SAM-dependent methyltransferase [Acidimicrobiia bacterium]